MESLMKKILLFLLIAFFCATAQSQENSTAPVEDAELKNLQWNRYVNKRFTIVSIDNNLGGLLADDIQDIKAKSLERWGFPDLPLSKECRIFCVPSQSILSKLFNLSFPKIQIRKELNVIWTVLDKDLDKSVLPYVTQVALSEYEMKDSIVLPTWFKRGAQRLSASPDEIMANLRDFNATAKREQFAFSAEQMFIFTEDEYQKQNAESRNNFDMQAVCLCLMLRKEFGEAKLQGFLRLQNRNKPESVLKVIYGFVNFTGFENKYYEYIKDLTADVVDRRTPESYLAIVAAER